LRLGVVEAVTAKPPALEDHARGAARRKDREGVHQLAEREPDEQQLDDSR